MTTVNRRHHAGLRWRVERNFRRVLAEAEALRWGYFATTIVGLNDVRSVGARATARSYGPRH